MMNLNGSDPSNSECNTHADKDLSQLIERCKRDLAFTNLLLHQLENPQASESPTGINNLIAGTELDQSIYGELGLQNSATLGAEAIHRLTRNIEDLTLVSGQADVQVILRAMHMNMVRCLKLVPAQR